jgi:hypothetical protein
MTKKPRIQLKKATIMAAIPLEIRISWFACTFILLEPFATYVVTVVLRPRRAALAANDAIDIS